MPHVYRMTYYHATLSIEVICRPFYGVADLLAQVRHCRNRGQRITSLTVDGRPHQIQAVR